MRSMWKKVVCSAVLLTVSGFAADNTLLGTWKLNIKQSKLPAGAPQLKEFVTTRTAVNKTFYGNNNQVVAKVGVTESSSGKTADGSQVWLNYTAGYGSSAYVATGSATAFLFETITLTPIDANTLRLTTTPGNSVCRGEMYVAKNGKTMTTALVSQSGLGKPISLKLVYEKIK